MADILFFLNAGWMSLETVGILAILFLGAVLSFIITYLSAVKKLADGRKKWYKSLTKQGVIFIIFCAVATILPIIQYLVLDGIAKRDQERKETFTNAFYWEFIKHQRLETKSIINELGKYGFMYENAEKRIAKLVRDSMRTNIIQREVPTLALINDKGKYGFEMGEGKATFKYSIVSNGATAKDIKLRVSFMYTNDLENLNEYISDAFRDIPTIDVVLDESRFMGSFVRMDTTSHYKYLVTWWRGSYVNASKTLSFDFDQLLAYHFDQNVSIGVFGVAKEKTIELIKTKEARFRK